MEFSGPEWCARFPCSKSLDDLMPDFAGRVRAFLSALSHAGARISIADTYRPPQRAYLMHWCCMVGASGQDPDAVPPMADVAIDWLHGGDVAAARAAARAMMAGYRIRFPAALHSRHTQRRAIDMTIGWRGTLAVHDFDGELQRIASGPRSGGNPKLIEVGRSFGVIKLASDPPHWSDDGH
jgi:hypothetical protein